MNLYLLIKATQQNHDYSNRANKNENQARRDQRNCK